MLKIYNSLSGKIEEFTPIDPAKKTVTMYNCGPTVYDYCHIGNFRSFLVADLLRRTLELNDYHVRQIMNITDVGHLTDDDSLDDSGEDKMALGMKKKKGKFDNVVRSFKDPFEMAQFYGDAFLNDYKELNLKPAENFPKATEHIPEMVAMIADLLEKEMAYKAADGTIYFDITKYPDYGKLSNNTLDKLQSGAGGRLAAETIAGKKNPQDFSLWKHDEKHLMKWDTEIGVGYPGWHIECSAMSMKYLGSCIDIHTGGEDNKFPHHECELAQSESFSGKKFVNYWVHGKHLMVDGGKMSKSKGNFYTVRQLLDKGYHPLALRWALMSAHFTKSLNFTLKGLDEAHAGILKCVRLKDKLETINKAKAKKSEYSSDLQKYVIAATLEFKNALNDNLNLALAQSVVFKFITKVNSYAEISAKNADECLSALRSFDSVLGVIFDYRPLVKKVDLDEAEILELIGKRNAAKANKNFKLADSIRDDLKNKGIQIIDGADGSSWKPL